MKLTPSGSIPTSSITLIIFPVWISITVASLSSSLGFTERRYLEANVEYGSRLFVSSSGRLTYTPSLSSSRVYSPDVFFTEAVSTFISSSREHPTLEEREIFYTTGSSLGYLSPIE